MKTYFLGDESRCASARRVPGADVEGQVQARGQGSQVAGWAQAAGSSVDRGDDRLVKPWSVCCNVSHCKYTSVV